MWILEDVIHLSSVPTCPTPPLSSLLSTFFLYQDKLDIRQAVDGGHVVSGLTEVVVKDKEQVSA